jgi:hypothetical protein
MISFKGKNSVFLEAPVQFPEMLLLPEFARGEASIVVTINPATWRESSLTCEPIRSRSDLKAIVADAGLSRAYSSNRAFLDVDKGTIVARTRGAHGLWRDNRLSLDLCPTEPKQNHGGINLSPFFTVSRTSTTTTSNNNNNNR